MAKYKRIIESNNDMTIIVFRDATYIFELYPDDKYDEGGWISDDATIRCQVEDDLKDERFLSDFERDEILRLIEEIELADEFDIPELLEQLEEYETYDLCED